MRNVDDPEHNFAFELHQYFDAGSSGGSDTCVSGTIGVEQVEPVTELSSRAGRLTAAPPSVELRSVSAAMVQRDCP
jgi:hypothetical protein